MHKTRGARINGPPPTWPRFVFLCLISGIGCHGNMSCPLPVYLSLSYPKWHGEQEGKTLGSGKEKKDVNISVYSVLNIVLPAEVESSSENS